MTLSQKSNKQRFSSQGNYAAHAKVLVGSFHQNEIMSSNSLFHLRKGVSLQSTQLGEKYNSHKTWSILQNETKIYLGRLQFPLESSESSRREKVPANIVKCCKLLFVCWCHSPSGQYEIQFDLLVKLFCNKLSVLLRFVVLCPCPHQSQH